MTDAELIERIARRVARTGNDYAGYDEGITDEMANEIAREILPLVKAATDHGGEYCWTCGEWGPDESCWCHRLQDALRPWVEEP